MLLMSHNYKYLSCDISSVRRFTLINIIYPYIQHFFSYISINTNLNFTYVKLYSILFKG